MPVREEFGQVEGSVLEMEPGNLAGGCAKPPVGSLLLAEPRQGAAKPGLPIPPQAWLPSSLFQELP